MKTFHPQTKISFANLVALERCGLYEQALAELNEVWRDTDEPPDTASFTSAESADIILRCGSLIGFLGHNKQIADAQTKSKNLLTEARQNFIDLGNIEKIAECENYLALAYWRTGELNEAEIFVAEALQHALPNSSQTRLYSHLIKKMILIAFGKNADAAACAAMLENDFRLFGDAFLNGSFCTNFGIALKNLGKENEALKKFEFARYYHQKSRHQIYLGTVENNLAQLYKARQQFVESHEAIDNATKIFKRLKDRTREGFSLDTKAQIFLAEGKYAEALQAIEKAIAILRKSENSAYLAETYLTKAKITLYAEGFASAILALVDAVKIAEVKIGEAAAKNLIAEFESVLAEKNKAVKSLPEQQEDSQEKVEMILPPSLARYGEVQVVRINNDHFEKIGLPKNAFAVVAQIEINRGDLAAVTELATGAVVCGFYDEYFGIVCLEAKSGEPYLFDEKEITILGKVIGVCHSEKISNGKVIAEHLNLES